MGQTRPINGNLWPRDVTDVFACFTAALFFIQRAATARSNQVYEDLDLLVQQRVTTML